MIIELILVCICVILGLKTALGAEEEETAKKAAILTFLLMVLTQFILWECKDLGFLHGITK